MKKSERLMALALCMSPLLMYTRRKPPAARPPPSSTPTKAYTHGRQAGRQAN